MVGYRCYVLDAKEHILQAHDLDCESDVQAQSAAAGFLTQDPYHWSVEVWRATRKIVKLERDSSQRARLAHRMRLHNRPLGSPV